MFAALNFKEVKMKPNPGGTLAGEAILNREKEIESIVKSHIEIDSEPVKETLDLIWSDHYLVRNIKNNRRTYQFRYAILKKWWKVNRG
jgi:hypothetical protein